MPTADTATRAYTAAEVTAYEAYLSAVAEHNIVCARTGATTREKIDAAFAIDRAWKRFCEVASLEIRSVRDEGDVQRIKELTASIHDVADLVRSAFSMILAANGMGVIERRAEGIDPFEHDACVRLFMDAQAILKSALQKADAQ